MNKIYLYIGIAIYSISTFVLLFFSVRYFIPPVTALGYIITLVVFMSIILMFINILGLIIKKRWALITSIIISVLALGSFFLQHYLINLLAAMGGIFIVLGNKELND